MPRWIQYALVLVAGAVSFYASFTLGPRKKVGAIDTLVAAARPAAMPSALPQASAPVADASQPALGDRPARPTEPSRLDAGILQNPFAPLNLHASMDKPVVVAVVAPKPENKPPPKPAPAPVLPPPAPVAPPPPPTAPPLPFVVVGAIRGKDIAHGKPVVFLNEKGTSLVVTQGDDIHGTYKVENITANAIEFTYLPLGQRQSLPLAN